MIKHKKKIALLTLMVMLLNLLSPLGLLKKVEAATGTLEEKPVVVKNKGVSGDVLTLEIGVDSQEVLTGFDFSFKVKSEVGTPCQPSGTSGTTFAKVMKKATDFDEIELTQQRGTYTASTQTFRITGTYTAGGVEQAGYQELYTLTIKLASGVDASKLAIDDVIDMSPITGSLPTGLKVSYINASGGAGSRDIDGLKGDGFAEATKTISSIAISTTPSKTTYTHGDTVTRSDISDGVLTVNYDDGTSETVPMSDVAVRINSGSPVDVASPTIGIEYKGNTTSYPITVNDPVTALNVTSPMTTTEYNTGVAFDFTGLALQAVKKSGATVPLTVSDVSVSETTADVNSPNFVAATGGTSVEVSGTQTITFTYDGKTATQTAIVNDHVTGIDVTTQPTKKYYKYGETFTPAGAVVTITLQSGATSTINLPDASVALTAFNNTLTGSAQNITASMTIGANTYTAATPIVAEAYDYISGHTFTQPTKDQYNWGDSSLNLTGGKFVLTWASGAGTVASNTINLSSSSVTMSGFNSSVAGSQLITATYNTTYNMSDGHTINDSVTDSYYIDINNTAKTITITAPTNANTFQHGDALTFGNGRIDVEYLDGTHTFPTITGAMVTEVSGGTAVNMSPSSSDYNSTTHSLTKQLKISYSQDGKSASQTYNITLNNPINSIAIGTAPQTSFNVNEYETNPVPGGTIVPTRKAGDSDPAVTITDSMVSGLNTLTAGSRTATVSYTDPAFSTVTKTTTYGYSVTDSTISIAVNNPPTVSKYGDSLDLRSATLTVQKGSGPVTVPATSATVSGFSSTTLGSQTVTLEYDGKQTTFNVTVQDYVDNMTLVPNSVSDVLGTSLADLISNNNLKYQVKYRSEASPRSAVPLTASMVAGYNPNNATQNLTVTYTDNDASSFTNGNTFTDTLAVTLSNNVSAINFRVAPTKITYKDGETLDFTGAVVDLTYEDGSTGTGSISNITATLLDGSPVVMTASAADYLANGQQVTRDIRLTYTDPTTSLTGTKDYQITIVNDVRSISMHATPKDEYNVGDPIDLTVDRTNYGSILVHRAVGTDEVIDLDNPGITIDGFDTTATATNLPVTVKYKENNIEKSTSYNINVHNYVTKVEFEDAPVKTVYQYGDSVDLSGLKVKLTYAYGPTSYGLISDVLITESGSAVSVLTPLATEFDSTTHTLKKKVDLTYTDAASGETASTTYEFDVVDTLTSMQIHTPPTKLTYNVNDSLDLTDGELEVYRASDPTTAIIVPMVGTDGNPTVNVRDFDSTREHATLTLTVEYTENGVTADDTYDIAVIDSISSIVVNNPPTEGKVGDELDLSATTIDVVQGSGTIQKSATAPGVTITTFDKNTVGSQTVTINYGGKSDTFTYVVKDYVTGIAVAPKTVTAAIGDSLTNILTNNNVEYVVTYKSAGAQPAAAVADTMVSGYSSTSSSASQTLTVEYVDADANSATVGNSFTDTFTVTLANSVTGVDITGTPTVTTYNHGDTLSLNGMAVTLTYADSTTGSGSLSDIVITETDGSPLNMSPSAADFGTSTTITKNVKLKYTDASSGLYDEETISITIVNDLRSIDMFSTPKTTYNIGESLDVTGGEIEVVRAVGAADIVSLSDPNVQVTGFSSAAENTSLPLTVKYTENGVTKSTSYTVSVTDSVTSVVIKTLPKQDYKYNETLDVSGGVITVTRGSGPEDIAMLPSMVKEMAGTEFDSTVLGTRNLKVTYGGKSATYPVTIKDYVTGIKVNPDSVTGKYNDELSTLINNKSIKYTVTYAKAGDQTPVSLPTTMVTTAYDKTSTTAQTLTVEYTDNDTNSATNGTTFNDTLTVTLEDDILSIAMDTTPKTNYEYGDSLDVAGGTIKVTRISGDHIVSITQDMVTEMNDTAFDSTIMNTRNLKVTYEGKTTSYEVTVSDAVDGINFNAPTKVVYNYNEELDLTGGYLQKVMKSGAPTSRIPLTDPSVTVSGYNKTQVGAQTVTVNYEGTNYTYGVAVNDGLTKIEITTLPSKTNYKYGDALSTSGGIITLYYAGGSTQTKSITPSMVSGYDPNTLGPQTLVVEYDGMTDTYPINVEDYVDDLELVLPNRLTYGIGDTLDLTGGTVKAIMASGAATTPVAMSSVSVTGFDSTTEGTKTITVSYQGKTKTFGVTVSDEAAGWVILSVPDQLTYRYGESLDLTGAELQVTKASGASQVINVTSDMISGYNPNRLGNQNVKVTYAGETKELCIVTVEDYIKRLNVKAPTKTVYHYGEDIDLTGGTVSIVMASGAIQETTDLTASMISGYDSTDVGTQTIPVEYKGLTGSFNVKLIDEVKGVSINTEPYNKTYTQGDVLDVTGGTLTVVRDSGIYTVPMTGSMATGYSPDTPGSQIVTITYEGKTVTYVVNVNKKPEDDTGTKSSGNGNCNCNCGSRVVYTSKSRSGGTRVVYSSTPSSPTSEEPEQTPSPVVPEEPKQEEKNEEPKQPTNNTTEKQIRTLGEKDNNGKKEDKGDWRKPVFGSIIGIALLLLLLLLLLRRNVKVYVQEDKTKDEFVLGGLDKIKKNDPKLDIDKFLDEDTYPNKVKVVLNDSISEKLDGEEIEVTHRGQKKMIKVKYEDKPFEFILY